jgi:hypothetical protein
MPEDIPQKRGVEKTQHIVLKTENRNKEVCRELTVSFAEAVNVDHGSITSDVL